MANISTNQVKQLYVLSATDTLSLKTVDTADGEDRGAFFEVLNSGSAVIDKTDLIPLDNVMSITTAAAGAAQQQLRRKGFLIKLNSSVNSGAPVAGQDYVITLTYRGNIGEEATYHKFAEAHATTGMTAEQLMEALAKSFLANSMAISGQRFFNLFAYDGTALNDSTTIASKIDASHAYFYLVEPVPYWSLGRFPESLEKMSLGVEPIVVNSDLVANWLDNGSFTAIDMVAKSTTDSWSAPIAPIYNSHKIADLEYFCKGERGLSAPLHVPYRDQIAPKLLVNPNATYGYDILTIHYAFIGHNAANQRSEKDIVIIIPSAAGSDSVNSKLSSAASSLKAAINPS